MRISSEAWLFGTSLYTADLSRADLHGANFRSARLEKALLVEANLRLSFIPPRWANARQKLKRLANGLGLSPRQAAVTRNLRGCGLKFYEGEDPGARFQVPQSLSRARRLRQTVRRRRRTLSRASSMIAMQIWPQVVICTPSASWR